MTFITLADLFMQADQVQFTNPLQTTLLIEAFINEAYLAWEVVCTDIPCWCLGPEHAFIEPHICEHELLIIQEQLCKSSR